MSLETRATNQGSVTGFVALIGCPITSRGSLEQFENSGGVPDQFTLVNYQMDTGDTSEGVIEFIISTSILFYLFQILDNSVMFFIEILSGPVEKCFF